jgi:acyl carrier protein
MIARRRVERAELRAEYTPAPPLVVDWRRIPPAQAASRPPVTGAHASMNKNARIRDCLTRAGLERLPPGDADDLHACGLDSLLSVLTIIELQKEFETRIQADRVTESSFDSVDNLATLVPD